jgi:hypothetical protein
LNRPHIFSLFCWSSKIHVSLTHIVSSLSPIRCCLSSGSRHHVSFPLNQDELNGSASSFGNASFPRLPSRVKTEALNLYHRRRSSLVDHLTPIVHYYKNGISSLPNVPNHSTASLFCLLPSQSTTLSELHTSSSFPFTVVPYTPLIYTTTPTVTN